MRVFLKIAYDGTNYHGWQYQTGQNTIEGEIRDALRSLLSEEIDVIGASRTDAGVHALGNVAVFDTTANIPADRYVYALNTLLPEDIKIVESKKVSSEFNPRFDAKSKTYEYKILNDEILLPTKRLYAYHYRGDLNIKNIKKACEYFIGEHDFTSFSSVHAQVNSFVRTVFSCEVNTFEKEVIFKINGNGFLYNMVRIISGTLLDVGIGKKSPEDIRLILDARDRTKAGPTLPACGLILKEIYY